jgi:hypothetical protein
MLPPTIILCTVVITTHLRSCIPTRTLHFLHIFLGFTIKGSRPATFHSVATAGVATDAGVVAGDRLVAFNRECAAFLSHEQVIKRIQACGHDKIRMLVSRDATIGSAPASKPQGGGRDATIGSAPASKPQGGGCCSGGVGTGADGAHSAAEMPASGASGAAVQHDMFGFEIELFNADDAAARRSVFPVYVRSKDVSIGPYGIGVP